jgi:DNA-directed RNA polymerase specialized sigma24 family protein
MRRQKAEEIQDPHESMTFRTLSADDAIPLLEDETMNLYLMHLTENQQRWVIHKVFHMKSEAEIAEIFGVTVYAVKSWRKSAIKRLRAVLISN